MKVAAFGRTHWLYDSILAVEEQGHEIVLIGTCPTAPESTVNEHDFARLAEQLGCPYFCEPAINRLKYIQMAQKSGAEVAISVNWLTIIRQKMLDLFEHGIINAHCGDLPRYRGNACPNWAIINGETEVVLTLHQMVEDLDAGPILLQRKFPLTDMTYIADVYRFIEQNVPEMFARVVDGLAGGTITPHPQPTDPSLSLRCFPRLPQDGLIDWNQSAEELARLVRASAEPFAGAYTFFETEKLIVWRAHAEQLPYPYSGIPGQVAEIRRKIGEVAILTAKGILVLSEIETERYGRTSASKIIQSMRSRLGDEPPQMLQALQKRILTLEKFMYDSKTTNDTE